MENNSIDKTFNEASKNLEEPATFPGFDKVWAKVEEKLDKKEEKRRKTIPAWFPYSIAASLLIGSGIFYFTGKKEKTEISQLNIANHTISSKASSAGTSGHIRKIDSTVKANIQNEILPAVPEKIAYRKVSKIEVPSLAVPVYEMPVPQTLQQETPAVAEEKMMMDTAIRQNTEEVIAMGIIKEKASMVNTLSATSSLPLRKKISGLKVIADTAEAVYPTASLYDHKDQVQEPEILAYNNEYLKKNQPIAGAQSGLGNRIGSKEVLNSIQGAAPGVSINSISGSPGSGKVNISISCQSSVRSGNNPLFIIDGTESDSESFKRIDPKKIESIRVFKGEKSTALFGSKAINGVVVVETKNISKKEKRRLKKLFKEKLPKK